MPIPVSEKEAFDQCRLAFGRATQRAYQGPWKTYGSRVLLELRTANVVLYRFVSALLGRHFQDVDFEQATLCVALFLDSLPGIPRIVPNHTVEQLNVHVYDDSLMVSPVDTAFFDAGLEGALSAYYEYTAKLCGTNKGLHRRMLYAGCLIAAAIVHHDELAHAA